MAHQEGLLPVPPVRVPDDDQARPVRHRVIVDQLSTLGEWMLIKANCFLKLWEPFKCHQKKFESVCQNESFSYLSFCEDFDLNQGLGKPGDCISRAVRFKRFEGFRRSVLAVMMLQSLSQLDILRHFCYLNISSSVHEWFTFLPRGLHLLHQPQTQYPLFVYLGKDIKHIT